MKGYIHSVETFGSVDGPGIRYIVFMQGCPLRCLYCHNPDSWKLKDGEQVTVKKLVSDILEYKRFVLSGGVTLSGGEPLVQKRFVLKLIKELKKHKIHVAIDTAGSLPIRESKEIIDHADLIILDIKSLDKEQCKELTGMSNKNTLATLDYCEKTNKPVWIRHVVVPGYTLKINKLKELAKFLKQYKTIKTVDLLPFHKFGEYKWDNLGYDYKLKKTAAPSSESMTKVRNIFKKEGLPVIE